MAKKSLIIPVKNDHPEALNGELMIKNGTADYSRQLGQEAGDGSDPGTGPGSGVITVVISYTSN